MQTKTTTYETVTLSFDEIEELLRKGLGLDKHYDLTMSHAGDILWEYKLEARLTKTTENK